MFPLRITFAFKGEKGNYCVESSVNIAEKLKLYTAEFEVDVFTVNSLINRLSVKEISAHNKIIRVADINLLEKILDNRFLFTEIQFEFPYFFTTDELKNIFFKLEKFIQMNKIVISIYLNKSNINLLETFLELASKLNIKKIVIPNPDLIEHLKFVKKYYLTLQDLNQIDIIKKYMPLMDFSVHDFFMAKRLGIKDALLFRGCQSGKFLCYILNGNVYPCKTIPILCGNLDKESFEVIWKKVDMVVNKISKGKLCLKCGSSNICYYGCPGTVFFINNGIKDPLCEEQYGNIPG